MPARLLSFAAAFAVLLAGCTDPAQNTTQHAQGTGAVQQAVRQQYRAQRVRATAQQFDGKQWLDLVLVNPGGQEDTDQQAARALAGTARAAYGDSALDTVRVSFEYSSTSGSAEVGYYRRYTFAPGQLEGAGTTASDTTASDTTARALPGASRNAHSSAAPPH